MRATVMMAEPQNSKSVPRNFSEVKWVGTASLPADPSPSSLGKHVPIVLCPVPDLDQSFAASLLGTKKII